MKTNCWLVLGTMIATSAVAQVNTNKLPAIPAPASTVAAPMVVDVPPPASTNAVAHAKKKAVAAKKKVVKKISEPTVALTSGPATVLSDNLNLRGQAGMKGEVIGHAKKGDTVTVLSQINLDKHAADEPAQWAKILLPSGTKVWVNTHFVDETNKVVTAKKLNLRAGPGENYSVLGVIEKGTAINELETKGDWAQIETPANAFAFVAAMYLKQEAGQVAETMPTPTPEVATTVPPTPPMPTPVPEPTPIIPQPPVPTPTPDLANTAPPLPSVDTNAIATVVDTNPPPPRIVTHEGYVRGSTSIVAPTAYELYDAGSGNAINYLYSTNVDVSRYDGFDIIVTGEEGLSPRWAATPVLTIQKIFVASTNQPVIHRVSSPHGSQETTRASKPPQNRR